MNLEGTARARGYLDGINAAQNHRRLYPSSVQKFYDTGRREGDAMRHRETVLRGMWERHAHDGKEIAA